MWEGLYAPILNAFALTPANPGAVAIYTRANSRQSGACFPNCSTRLA